MVTVTLALIFGKYIPYCLMGYCIVAAALGDRKIRMVLLFTLISASIAAIISWTIGYFVYTPRPFVEPIGHTMLSHKDNASFPSNHMMFITIFTYAFLKNGYKKTGLVFIFLALSIGWSRIFLGVHYPVDIVGGALIAIIVSALFMMLLEPKRLS